MASIQRTQRIYVQPDPVAPARQRRRRRHRILKAIIFLTVPFYCVGFTILTTLRVRALVSQAASSPLFLGGLVVFALLLLMEPFTGAVTNSCAVGAKCAAVGAAEPVSCLTTLAALAGIIALAVWLL
jgi:hypothetical protein